ncbi:MAG: alpha/beta hydrolase [Colwelliaceae bacterium]|nr:alpha/beta hydrolase [Colwelliaceae bacterium]
MKLLFKTLSAAIFLSTLTAQAEELTLTTDKGFALKADYYQSNTKSNRAVLMLHQCNYNRTMYDNIGEQLSQQGIHALSLDFRGFGESINDEFDIDKVQALPQEQRRSAWRKMSTNWGDDVQQAYDYLISKVSGKASVGVIGASCGGSQAINLAEKNPIQVISFFSSGQREENIERYSKMLAAKPTLIIASEDDGGTYTSAQTLFKKAKNTNSKFIAYKGGDHGYPLLDKDKHLATNIVSWFNNQL